MLFTCFRKKSFQVFVSMAGDEAVAVLDNSGSAIAPCRRGGRWPVLYGRDHSVVCPARAGAARRTWLHLASPADRNM
jgi:hypothetical protein